VVSATTIDAPNVTLPADLPQVDVLLLPRETGEGRGLYDDSVDTLAKEIRASGATAEYQHDASSRGWIGEKHLPVIELDVIAGILSNAGWAGLRAVVAKRKVKRVRVKVGRRKETPSGLEEEWIELEGPGIEVANALEVLQQGGTVDAADGETA
jgi:hypothetical protein